MGALCANQQQWVGQALHGCNCMGSLVPSGPLAVAHRLCLCVRSHFSNPICSERYVQSEPYECTALSTAPIAPRGQKHEQMGDTSLSDSRLGQTTYIWLHRQQTSPSTTLPVVTGAWSCARAHSTQPRCPNATPAGSAAVKCVSGPIPAAARLALGAVC